jgi:hypothetical protein
VLFVMGSTSAEGELAAHRLCSLDGHVGFVFSSTEQRKQYPRLGRSLMTVRKLMSPSGCDQRSNIERTVRHKVSMENY